MRSWQRAPAAAASAIATAALALAACSGSGPASPAATEPVHAPSGAVSAAPGPAAGAADWPTYHGSLRRTGVSGTMPAAGGTLTRVQSLKLDADDLLPGVPGKTNKAITH